MSKTGFSIISSQRSGSTMLVNILDQHPDIICAGEIFKKKDTQRILHPEFSFDLPKQLDSFNYKLNPTRALRRHVRSCMNSQKEVFGFKLMTSQIDTCPQLEKVLTRLGFKKIVLIREDIAAQALSLELARASKKWVNTDTSLQPPEKVNIHIQALGKTITYFRRAQDKLKELSLDTQTLVLTYEQLMNDRATALASITSYLGLSEAFTYELDLLPSSHLSYEERISNSEEVASVLNDHGLPF